MKTKYEMFIDAVAYAMGDHSYTIQWYYDFDTQETSPVINGMNGHRVLKIEPLESRIGFRIMEDFVDSLPEGSDKDKLWSSLRQRHPFSAFKNMLHYTGQRENWFAFKDERMQIVVEAWMEEEGIVYKDGVFSCNGEGVYEYFYEMDDD